MKKLPKYLTTIVFSMGIWGAFLFPNNLKAATIYQQLSDSSADKELSNSCVFIGSFLTNESPGELGTSGVGALVVVRNDSTTQTNTLNLYVSSSTLAANCIGSDWGSNGFPDAGDPIGTSTDDLFLPEDNTLSSGSSYQLAASTIYNVYLKADNTNIFVRTNLGGNFWYGYLTDSLGNSIPIIPGLPGFTDYGIATSSQEIYCDDNFSTSTGLLDNIGASFARGICNVSVFLFVPSSNALSQFQGIASSTRMKIPFSYYYDVQDIFTEASASSSVNMQSFSLNLSTTGVGSTSPMGAILQGNKDLLSTTTINTYLPEGLYDTLMLMARSAIWIGVMFHIYRRIRPTHALNHI